MQLDQIAAELQGVVTRLDASCLEGHDALERVREAAEIERLAAVAKALYAKRCVETGVWRTDDRARVAALTPAEWLADVSGSGIGAARDALVVADALPDCGTTDTALRCGQVSLAVAREVTAAAEVGGELAETRVLGTAKREGLRAARDETRRVLAHASDAAEREARIHRQRARHTWVSRDGVWNLRLQGPVAAGAEIEACLAPFDDAAWDAASRQRRGERDAPDAISFDGFLACIRARDGHVAGSSKPRGRAKTRDHVVVHVDAQQLLGGAAGAGTTGAGTAGAGGCCEIPGVGPVPVDHARSLLGDALLTVLVEDGRDVKTFARPGRKMVAALRQLLDARDPVCTIVGCGRAQRLEHDHAQAVSDGGDSTVDNTSGLCKHHHALKSKGWVLTEHSDGTRTLDPPRPAISTPASADDDPPRREAASPGPTPPAPGAPRFPCVGTLSGVHRR
jgi:hypothetical protein